MKAPQFKRLTVVTGILILASGLRPLQAGAAPTPTVPTPATVTEAPVVVPENLKGTLGWHGAADLATEQYATEATPGGRVDLDLHWHGYDGPRDTAEARLIGFYQSGSKGDYSFDLDPVHWKLPFHHGYYWLGRHNPAEDSRPEGSVSRTTAVGANWVQNQSDSLNPRVSGWVSVGLRQELEGTPLSATAAYSPFFLPSFGPGISFSDTTAASGSRFVRLPPSYARVNDALVPLRYQIDTGDVSRILLQNQFFVSLDHQTEGAHYSLVGWSAPSPSPKVDTNAYMRVRPDDIAGVVIAVPHFMRQQFVGTMLDWSAVWAHPEASYVYEAQSGKSTVSVSMTPIRGWSLGGLHTFNQKSNAVVDSNAYPTPTYANGLVWTEVGGSPFPRWDASLRWEQNLVSGDHGKWISPRVQYAASRAVSVFGMANLIAGEDYSYFGAWRSLGSVSAGVRVIW